LQQVISETGAALLQAVRQLSDSISLLPNYGVDNAKKYLIVIYY
jgi:hypothetical protein